MTDSRDREKKKGAEENLQPQDSMLSAEVIARSDEVYRLVRQGCKELREQIQRQTELLLEILPTGRTQ